jgi:hypothetical protein
MRDLLFFLNPPPDAAGRLAGVRTLYAEKYQKRYGEYAHYDRYRAAGNDRGKVLPAGSVRVMRMDHDKGRGRVAGIPRVVMAAGIIGTTGNVMSTCVIMSARVFMEGGLPGTVTGLYSR